MESAKLELIERSGRVVVLEALDVSQVGAQTNMICDEPRHTTAEIDADVVVGE